MNFFSAKEPAKLKWEDAKIEAYPYNAFLRYSGEFFTRITCSGVIITDRHILTSAFCVEYLDVNTSPSNITVHTSTANTTSGEVHRVKNIRAHEDFSWHRKSTSMENNIALVEVYYHLPCIFFISSTDNVQLIS